MEKELRKDLMWASQRVKAAYEAVEELADGLMYNPERDEGLLDLQDQLEEFLQSAIKVQTTLTAIKTATGGTN